MGYEKMNQYAESDTVGRALLMRNRRREAEEYLRRYPVQPETFVDSRPRRYQGSPLYGRRRANYYEGPTVEEVD